MTGLSKALPLQPPVLFRQLEVEAFAEGGYILDVALAEFVTRCGTSPCARPRCSAQPWES